MLRRVRSVRSPVTDESAVVGRDSTTAPGPPVHPLGNRLHRTFPPGVVLGKDTEPAGPADDQHVDNRLAMDDRRASRVPVDPPRPDASDERLELGNAPLANAVWPEHKSRASEVAGLPLRGGYAFSKRATDIAVSVGLILFLAPLLVAIAVLIKLDSRGPVFFRQERFGLGGKSFRMTKFRTMVVDAPDQVPVLTAKAERGEIGAVEAPAFKSKDDPRVTSVGRHLRRFSLDELPQLFDVLLGSMSLVGPRPLVARETQALSEAERSRHLVKPGLTCLWQTSRRSRVSYQERMAMDIEYTRRMSFWLDLALLLKTPLAVVRGDGAF